MAAMYIFFLRSQPFTSAVFSCFIELRRTTEVNNGERNMFLVRSARAFDSSIVRSK